jgi:hypothetical protein
MEKDCLNWSRERATKYVLNWTPVLSKWYVTLFFFPRIYVKFIEERILQAFEISLKQPCKYHIQVSHPS